MESEISGIRNERKYLLGIVGLSELVCVHNVVVGRWPMFMNHRIRPMQPSQSLSYKNDNKLGYSSVPSMLSSANAADMVHRLWSWSSHHRQQQQRFCFSFSRGKVHWWHKKCVRNYGVCLTAIVCIAANTYRTLSLLHRNREHTHKYFDKYLSANDCRTIVNFPENEWIFCNIISHKLNYKWHPLDKWIETRHLFINVRFVQCVSA